MKARNTLAFTLAALLLSTAAHAADSAKLDDHESKGWGNKVGRFGGFFTMINGDRPLQSAPAGGTPDINARDSYKRTGFGIDFDVMGFWDATRFDTLIGAEFHTKLGFIKGEKIDNPKPDDKAGDENKILLRMDAAFDYALIHWGGAIKGRFAFGAGGGFDIDPGKWYAPKGRAYPLLLLRFQLWPGDAFGLHFSYHHVPTTTNDILVREHRFEGAIGVSSLQAGARFVINQARPANSIVDTYVSREMGAFVAYAF